MKYILILALLFATGCSTKYYDDPNVWAPLAVAAALQINDLDEQISDNLSERTPVFGSNRAAAEASDDGLLYTDITVITSAILTPAPSNNIEDWTNSKLSLIGSQWLVYEGTRSATSFFKGNTNRERPNGRCCLSFPSGHTSQATIKADMTAMNVNRMDLSLAAKKSINTFTYSLAAITAYARVEAKAHYPADVLAGWSLAHLIGNVAEDYIDPNKTYVTIAPMMYDDYTGAFVIVNF